MSGPPSEALSGQAMLDCPEHTQTSPTSTSWTTTLSAPGEETVSVIGLRECPIAGRPASKRPCALATAVVAEIAAPVPASDSSTERVVPGRASKPHTLTGLPACRTARGPRMAGSLAAGTAAQTSAAKTRAATAVARQTNCETFMFIILLV